MMSNYTINLILTDEIKKKNQLKKTQKITG
jgi:hypothetical protein